MRGKNRSNKYIENYCALIITILADVTPEEAFLSLDRKTVYKFINHKKYTTLDIYDMCIMRDTGALLEDIARRFEISVGTVCKIIKVYGG